MITRAYSKTGQTCRVTFRLPSEAASETVSVVGEFNDWNPEVHPLKSRKNGTFSTTISLQSGQVYRFRYLLDRQRWANDDQADDQVPNRFGDLDCVIGL